SRTRVRREAVNSRRGAVDIKYGPGGMLDIYFATRYLQLRDEVLDGGDDRSTAFTLERLREEGSLSEDDFSILSTGYSLLRSIDHNLRLIVGRSTRLPDPNHVTAADVARRMGFESVGELHQTLLEQMNLIRDTYNRLLG
ncbi:MAG TPA: hypothetical protein VM941_00855, partial [Pyrinomonadaceae bacterium]|nr:hypothetical protein [Pyrinomonadaceae bacterium]